MRTAVLVLGIDQPHPSVWPEVVLDFALTPDDRLPLAPIRDTGVGRLAEKPPQLITGRA